MGKGGTTESPDELPGVKTKRITNASKKRSKNSERRLVEYFCVVSSIPKKNVDGDKSVEMTASLTSGAPDPAKEAGMENGSRADANAQGTTSPPTNPFDDDHSSEGDEDEFVDDNDFQPVITARYPLEDHKGNPLQESVTCFCHPGGTINLRLDPCMPKAHYFVSTGGKGEQMYGTVLTIWEPFMLSAIQKKQDKHGEADAGGEDGDTSAVKKKEFYLPKCLVLISAHPYLIAFREFLVQLHRMSKMGDMPLPIERYIVNFCAEIPAPPPGSFEVQTTILDSTIKFWSPPFNQPITWVSLPFSHLFECLDIENIITVWHCLALERQVLFTSTQLSLLTECCEIVLSLLFPMRWSHAYIPVLPHFLIPMLSAPMPYLCGIDKGILADCLYDLSQECVVVDLDCNLVTLGPQTEPLPALPPNIVGMLRSKLEENVGMVFREARSLSKNDNYADRGIHLPSHVKMMSDAMWESRLCLFDEAFRLAFTPDMVRKNILNGNDHSLVNFSESDQFLIMSKEEKEKLRKQSQWDAVQEAFLDIYVYMLRNYRKFLVFPSKDNAEASFASYGGAGFRSNEFIDSQRYDMKAFLAQLVGTQMFDDFMTKRLYGSNDADIAFFDTAVDIVIKSVGRMANVDVTGRMRGAGAGGSATSSTQAGMDGAGGGGQGGEKRPSMARRIFQRGGNTASVRALADKPNGPLLQSARVHQKLKTIVPPEPSGVDLPSADTIEEMMSGAVISTIEEDEASIGSTSTSGTRSTKGTQSSVRSGTTGMSSITGGGTGSIVPPKSPSSALRRRQDRAHETEKHYTYTYQVFPSELSADLFGECRPLPQAVMAEFDRQREDAAKFRRSVSQGNKTSKNHIRKGNKNVKLGGKKDAPVSPESATFTVFFMAFTAVVGADLLEMSENEHGKGDERTILSTYTHPTDVESSSSSDEEASLTTNDEDSVSSDAPITPTATESGTGEKEDESGRDDDKDEEETRSEDVAKDGDDASNTDAANKDEEADLVSAQDVGNDLMTPKVKNLSGTATNEVSGETKPKKSRFRDKLSDLEIEEAKVTARAQLGLAFEMLDMMKKRGLKAEPDAFQYLIEACGRCGDTERASKLLGRMHEDGIVADGVVYSWLVTAFSSENAWNKLSGKNGEDLPDWANGASVEMDWNKLQKRSIREKAKDRIKNFAEDDADEEEVTGVRRKSVVAVKQIIRRRMGNENGQRLEPIIKAPSLEDKAFVSEAVLRQILLGESLLEIVYPDISIDTDNELCPRCNKLLTDDEVVSGWTSGNAQDYTTKCSICSQRFVPHFCVQSTAPSFVGSRGPGTPLLCERLSPWVLQKELRSVMSDRDGIEDLLDPDWRGEQTKNAILWWNLILSCMRYRFPFAFLLQGSFDTNLVAPTPVDDVQ